MTRFSIKTKEELCKPMGKCVRLLEDLQGASSGFKNIQDYIITTCHIEKFMSSIEGDIVNLGYVQSGIPSGPPYIGLGFYYKISIEDQVFIVPQWLVEIPDKSQIKELNEYTSHCKDIMIRYFSEEMKRSESDKWDRKLRIKLYTECIETFKFTQQENNHEGRPI